MATVVAAEELSGWFFVVVFGGVAVVLPTLWGLYKLWQKVRPEVLTPPQWWPKSAKYERATELFGSILLWPTRLGVHSDMLIINLWIASFIFVPVMLPIACVVWLFTGLPNHWIWFRLGQRR